jgi:hypothetical protein
VDSQVWWRLARSPSVVRRALRYAVGVGALLIAINHGDAIFRKDLSLQLLVLVGGHVHWAASHFRVNEVAIRRALSQWTA